MTDLMLFSKTLLHSSPVGSQQNKFFPSLSAFLMSGRQKPRPLPGKVNKNNSDGLMRARKPAPRQTAKSFGQITRGKGEIL
jgi:hypothetical protein